MSKNSQNILETTDLKKLQGLFLWLRLSATLFFVAGGWQLVIAVGLLSSLSLGSLSPLFTGGALLWLGWTLWQASQTLEPISQDIEKLDLTKTLTSFAIKIRHFFQWSVLFLVLGVGLNIIFSLVSVWLIVN
jgi:hypothetical protein